MADTHIKKLRSTLEQAADALKGFEEFRSPVNHAVVSAVWHAKKDDQIVRVAIREDHGHFYRGRIEGISANGGWDIVADDGELVPYVSADSFVSVRLEHKP
ncbi:hypothetical protein SEA_SATIS_281 [Streptomyces phage Satis]|nr:hypothetical protein SEA_SATIS_281 [Streptomyces phage Satis]QBZ72167.1 hypothetical protein SEA_KRADAL_281 [Streptomyces phage Kradal]QPL14589.1 hypothetical protein SEA_EHYELIMAYOE_284 [Streptomyces phage EhyElimayoE]